MPNVNIATIYREENIFVHWYENLDQCALKIYENAKIFNIVRVRQQSTPAIDGLFLNGKDLYLS